jgi:hypothetical protein
MLATPCNECCHFKNNQCSVNQHFIQLNNKSYAPGFCRIFRTNEWAINKDQDKLETLARKGSELVADMIIIYDPIHNSTKDIDLTIECSNSSITENIIIIDIGGPDNKKSLTDNFNYFRNSKYKNKMKIKHLAARPDNLDMVIRDTLSEIKSKYFAIIPAGKSMVDPFELTDHIKNDDTRFVFWPFIFRINETLITPSNPFFGLYITSVYQKLSKISEKNFNEILKQQEEELGIRLSYSLLGCELV